MEQFNAGKDASIPEIKQVIAVRTDLRMGKGKTAVHVAHAAVTGYISIMKENKSVAERWIKKGQKKIVVKVKDEKGLIELSKKAVEIGIPCFLVRDAGLTQIEPGTLTCIALGPWYSKELDKITENLKLL